MHKMPRGCNCPRNQVLESTDDISLGSQLPKQTTFVLQRQKGLLILVECKFYPPIAALST